MDDLEGHFWSCCSYERVFSISDRNVVSLAFGKQHCLFLTTKGNVYSFGNNHCGQLGTGNLDSHFVEPQQVLNIPSSIICIACGPNTSAAVTANGLVYMWGDNTHGQCAQSDNKTLVASRPVQFLDLPVVDKESKYSVIQISCAAQYTIALTVLHQVWVWGTRYGCTRTPPTILAGLSQQLVLSVACGYEHGLAVVLVNSQHNVSVEEEKVMKSKPKSVRLKEQPSRSENVCPLGLVVSSEPSVNTPDVDVKQACQEVLNDIIDSVADDECRYLDEEVELRNRSLSHDNVKRSGSFLDPQIAKQYLEKLTDSGQTLNEESSFEERETEPKKSTYVWDVVAKVRHKLDRLSFSMSRNTEEVIQGSDASSESFEVVETLLVETDIDNGVVRTGSLKSLLELKQATRSKNKNASLEMLALSETPKKESPKGSPTGKLSGLQTEVWTWGRGRSGQLGLGNHADRVEPFCVSSLNGQGVTRVLSGGHHSLALTLDGRLFSWGSNSRGQLGQSFGQESIHTPREVQLLEHQLIWDVSAGEEHTLLLADARAPRVVLYGCGGHSMEDGDESCLCPKEKGLHQLNILKKSGLVLRIFSGGPRSGCLVSAQRGKEGYMTSLHQWAASERWFLHQLNVLITKLLGPLLNDGVISSLAPVFREPLETMVSRLTQVVDLVSLSSHDLTLSVLGKSHHWNWTLPDPPLGPDCVAAQGAPEWIKTFWDYFQSMADIISVSATAALTKEWNITPSRLNMIGRDSMGESAVDHKTSSSEIMLHLLQIPTRRAKEYIQLIGRASLTNKTITTTAEEVITRWQQLVDSGSYFLSQADKTRLFWDAAPHKLVESYRSPHRRLVRDSKSHPMSVLSAGLFSSHWFILFNDILVHSQFGSSQCYPLQTVWVEPLPDDDAHQNAFLLRTPEDLLTLTCPTSAQKTEWVCMLNLTVKQLLDWEKDPLSRLRSWSGGSQRLSPPLPRQASFTFSSKTPALKDATYTGMWLCGKMHGHGRLTWPDGRCYVGKFKQNLQEGDGTLTLAETDDGKSCVFEGHWKDGKLNGFGSVRYPNGDLYEGFFRDDQKHGFGMMKQGSFTSASLYVGQWANNQRNGYGVLDNIHAGEKYMGQWLDDQCHGNGVVVTIDGVYYEGPFIAGKLQGSGLMLFEDGTRYQGELGPNGALNGKGTLFLSNGDTIEGTFGGVWSQGIKISGLFHKSTPVAPSLQEGRDKLCLGLGVPADQKWSALFVHCYNSLNIKGLSSSLHQDNQNAWEATAIALHKRRKIPRRFHKKRYSLEWPEENVDYLEHIPYTGAPRGSNLNWEEYQQVVLYLSKACDCPYHPLGVFVDQMVDVYRASYSGVGAHPCLLHHAVDEVKSFFTRFYLIVRVLFPDLPPEGQYYVVRPGQTYDQDSGPSETLSSSMDDEFEDILECDVVSGQLLVQKTLMPKVYQPLFTLYALHDEAEDEQYWKRLVKWNRQPDVPLMTFLGVDSQFWLCRDPPSACASPSHKANNINSEVLGYRNSLQSYSTIKEEYFSSAVETLQHISSQFSPMDKLKTVHRAFQEISKEVRTYLGPEFLWTMDYLFPVFQYVVVRARICHLGSEIHFMDDLMEKHLQMGELGIMFTTLKACYFQIRTEKLNF